MNEETKIMVIQRDVYTNSSHIHTYWGTSEGFGYERVIGNGGLKKGNIKR